MPIKGGWRDASLALWNFSRSKKHYILLSPTKAIYLSRFVFAMHTFAPIEISYSNTACNKSAAEASICLVYFYSVDWWSEGLRCHMYHVFFSE